MRSTSQHLKTSLLSLTVASVLSLSLVTAAGAAPTSQSSIASKTSATPNGGVPTSAEYGRADALLPTGSDAHEDGAWYREIHSTASPSRDFYRVPAELPAQNGAVIKSESMDFKLEPHDVIRTGTTATKIMYTSTDSRQRPVGVTGTLLEPSTPWKGNGPRPLIAFAPGTQGLGDGCEPSSLLSRGTEYEGLSAIALLKAGYNVVMTDYMGGGTEGTLSYLNRVDQGNALLDAARAGSNLRGGLSPDTPVGLWGYSQGGGAAASAGELASSYAPEINLKGVYAGAVPADLQATINNIDSTTYNAFALMGITALSDSNGLNLTPYLSQKGQEAVTGIRTQCIGEALGTYAKVNTSAYTLSGQRLSAFTAANPEFMAIAQDNNLGQGGRHPSVPTLIGSSWGDDVIPHKTNRELANRYCKAGTRLSFHTDSTPTHVGAMVTIVPRALIFFDRQFKGLANTNDCWQVGA